MLVETTLLATTFIFFDGFSVAQSGSPRNFKAAAHWSGKSLQTAFSRGLFCGNAFIGH